jgi:hypothetical protein
MAKRVWPPPRLTGDRWAKLSVAERVELVAAIEEVGEAVVERLALDGLVVEETAPGRYRCVPLSRP